jgi:hypothetical protein
VNRKDTPKLSKSFERLSKSFGRGEDEIQSSLDRFVQIRLDDRSRSAQWERKNDLGGAGREK